MSYTEKKIKAIFTLSDKTFKDGSDQLSLEGLRMQATIESYGILQQGTTHLRIWGMLPEDMNTLATLAIRTGISANGLTLLAGDDDTGLTQVFSGTIYSAYADYNGLPNVEFCVEAAPGWFEKMAAAAPNSFKGGEDVGVIMAALAAAAGFAFVNHGVNVQLTNHYVCGSIMQQIQDVVTATGIGCRLANNTLEIWPAGESTNELAVELSSETGLVGYPEFSPYGLSVTTEFNPALIYGRKVSINSTVIQACGDFTISRCQHNISCQVPHGPWFTTLGVWNNDVQQLFK
ncbi:baseplate hub protein [Klebsiella pneumoniae]|uniref:baseplate hub protein n=1 Tax=Klebsiella pneumoniae TaxID=573 RepID=UPI001F4AC1F0|nr:hypothetical protein [Klebsiella pneumoniae]HBW3346577.1 hypothetical protein [Klebsiella pneumoniae]